MLQFRSDERRWNEGRWHQCHGMPRERTGGFRWDETIRSIRNKGWEKKLCDMKLNKRRQNEMWWMWQELKWNWDEEHNIKSIYNEIWDFSRCSFFTQKDVNDWCNLSCHVVSKSSAIASSSRGVRSLTLLGWYPCPSTTRQLSVLPIKVFLRMNFKANITVHRCWEGITQKLSKFPPAACFGTNFEEPTFEFGWFHLSGNSCEGFLQFDCLHLMLSRWLPLFGNAIHIKYIQIIYSIYQSLPFAMVRCWFIVLQPLLAAVKCWARPQAPRAHRAFKEYHVSWMLSGATAQMSSAQVYAWI